MTKKKYAIDERLNRTPEERKWVEEQLKSQKITKLLVRSDKKDYNEISRSWIN